MCINRDLKRGEKSCVRGEIREAGGRKRTRDRERYKQNEKERGSLGKQYSKGCEND